MLNIPDSVKALFKRDGVHKNFRAHFPNGELPDITNDNIVQESVRFTESVCSQDVFKFGLTEASTIEFETVGAPNMYGMTAECSCEIDCSSLSDTQIAEIEAGTWDGRAAYTEESSEQKTFSGDVVSFCVGADAEVSDFDVNVTYTQSGSGDPSPSNIRPITGYASANIVVSHALDAQYGVTYPVSFGAAGTVFRGVLNVLTGELTVTWIGAKVSDMAWTYNFGKFSPISSSLITTTKAAGIANIACSAYPVYDGGYGGLNPPDYCIAASEISSLTFVKDTRFTDASTWRAAMGDTLIVWELETPQVYQLTMPQIALLNGTNFIWSDAGSIERLTVEGTWLSFFGFSIPYGTFRVESCPRDHQAMTHRKVTAYTEDLIKDEDAFHGQFPNAKMRFYPDEYLFAKELETSDMQQEKANVVPVSADEDARIIRATTTDDTRLIFTGVFAIPRAVYSYSSYPNPITQHRKVFLRFDYSQTQFDSYSKQLFDAAIATIPSVSPIYYYNGGTQQKVYKDNKTAAAISFGMFAPCFFVVASYKYVSGSSTYQAIQISEPVFVEPGQTYAVNTQDLRNFKFPVNLPSSNCELYGIEVYASIPWAWRDTAYWTKIPLSGSSTQYAVPNWPIADMFPEGVSVIYRNEDNKPSTVYVKEVVDSSEDVSVLIENTLTIKKKPLGTYFTYSNSVSVRELINGYLELHAQFATAARSGGNKIIRINNTSPVAVLPGEYSQMWFDEYNVEPIGTVRYAYTDEAGEEQIVDYKFGDGASVYDMTDNEVLKLMDGADPSVIEALLDAYFIPNLAPVNFVPVDLSMKGLPYIEAGDALSVTAQDATACNSYALRHEISGIQALEAQIDSQSGMIIDSEAGA